MWVRGGPVFGRPPLHVLAWLQPPPLQPLVPHLAPPSPCPPGPLHTRIRKWQYWVDRSVLYTKSRWIGLAVALVLFALRIYMLNGWFIVAYGLGIFLLNLLIGFVSPQVSDVHLAHPVHPKRGCFLPGQVAHRGRPARAAVLGLAAQCTTLSVRGVVVSQRNPSPPSSPPTPFTPAGSLILVTVAGCWRPDIHFDAVGGPGSCGRRGSAPEGCGRV